MASKAHQLQWQKIEQMTQQLHELAADENWQGLIELEAERLVMIKEYFSDPVSADEAAGIAENIRKILHSDDVLVQLGQQKKEEASNAVQKLSTNRKAINAYSHIQK